ncbi:MAG: ATP-binding protein [Patescibacteria group bacterium]
MIGILIIIFTGFFVYYFEYFIKETFTYEIEKNLHALAKANYHSYLAFSNEIKMHALELSSENSIKEFTEKIFDTNSSDLVRKKAATDLSEYISKYKMTNDSSILSVDIIDDNGIVVASTHKNHIGIDERKKEIDFNYHYFSKAIKDKTGETFIRSAIFKPEENSKPVSNVAMRIFSKQNDKDGNLIPLPGVFLIHFTIFNSFTDFIKKNPPITSVNATKNALKQENNTELYIVNYNEQMVVVPESQNINMLGSYITTPPIKECFERGKGVSSKYFNYAGIPVFGVSICFKDEGVVLLNEISITKAYDSLQELTKQAIFGISIFLFVSIVIIFLFVRRPLKNLSLLFDTAKSTSQRDYSKKIPVLGNDEISHLANIFNTLIETISIIQEQIQESENKLAEEKKGFLHDLNEHNEQSKFIQQSKQATQNLLEDAWEIKEKLEIEKNRLQTVLSSIGDGLILIDSNYKIILVNPKAIELLAISFIELYEKDLRKVIKLIKNKKGELPINEWPIEKMFILKNVVIADLEDKLSMTTEKQITPIPITLSVAPLMEDDKKIKGGVIVIRDVTEDRKLNEAKSEFISIASHQLRTPLTTIRWYSEMLLDDDADILSEQQREFLNEIHNGTKRLYKTIDLLLGISRIEGGKLKEEKKLIDFALFINDLKKELDPQMLEKKLKFLITPPENNSVMIHLNPLLLRQVLLNLISNSIRYTNDNGIIEVRWNNDKEKNVVICSVKDDGIGIPLLQQKRIFSKFFRAENAISKIPDGSGLGLALVKEIILSWNGNIWFETMENKGTTFFFTIPF